MTVDLRGSAKPRSPTVRVLAAYSGHTDCNLATLAFASGVDMDNLLDGTPYRVPVGQSPFALARGNQFERMIRADGYARALELLRTRMGFAVKDARTVNLRTGFPRNREGMAQRAKVTGQLIERILRRHPAAPNLIDGAVLEGDVGGRLAFFEADAIAAQFASPIHAGEVKSFPVVDGRAEPDKLGAALDQVAVYVHLTQQLVARLGGDPETAVSTTAMLIAPRNVGLTPTLETQDVRARVRRVATLLGRPIPIGDLAAGLPAGVFGRIGDRAVDPSRRIAVLDRLAARVGTKYATSCLATCGAARYCRDRQVAAGAPVIAGEHLRRLLPGVSSLPRALELATGTPPAPAEAPAAAQLARAARLYAEKAGSTPGAATISLTP